jgi:hypothetical protein
MARVYMTVMFTIRSIYDPYSSSGDANFRKEQHEMNWKQTVILLNILAMSSTGEHVVYETEPDTPIDAAVVPNCQQRFHSQLHCYWASRFDRDGVCRRCIRCLKTHVCVRHVIKRPP